jgi:hypothetical protein
VAQFPLPIFSATATGLGSEKVIATVEGVGVGVGPAVAELPPPQPVEMATSKESNRTKSTDRIITKFLVDIVSPARKSVTLFIAAIPSTSHPGTQNDCATNKLTSQ